MNRRQFLSKGGLTGCVFLAGTPYLLPRLKTPRDLVRVERVYVSMGTTVRFLVFHEDGREALSAIQEAYAFVQKIHRLMSVQEPKSDLSRWNRSETGLDAPFDVLTTRAIDEALLFAALTVGRFDPTFGTVATRKAMPTLLSRAERVAGWSAENRRLDKVHPDLRLDLGGSAKGWAVDQAMDVLLRRGVTNTLINAGGDLRVVGCPPGEEGWTIGIRDPRSPDQTYCELELTDCSVATSGGYESEGSTIVDPRDGRKISSSGCTTVLAPACGEADCLSTALFVDEADGVGGSDVQFLVAEPDGGELIVGYSTGFPTQSFTPDLTRDVTVRLRALSGR